MAKALIFDFDSTLVDYRYGDSLGIERVRLLSGIKASPEAFYETSRDIIIRLYSNPSKFKGDVLEARIAELAAFYGVQYRDELLAEYLVPYLSIVRVYDGVVEFLEHASKRARIGLLTNSIDSDYQRTRIEASGLAPYFDAIAIANELGVWKPDKEAFHAVARMLGAKPAECVFVGDSEKLDIVGAKNAGMRSVKRLKTSDGAAASAADFVFVDYRELAGMIDRSL